MFDVSHSTFYEYAQTVEHSTHLFRLMPTDDLCQDVVHSKLSLTADAEEIQFEDVFGNQSVHCEIKSQYRRLTVTATQQMKQRRSKSMPTVGAFVRILPIYLFVSRAS